jgi:hypothetical protein
MGKDFPAGNALIFPAVHRLSILRCMVVADGD